MIPERFEEILSLYADGRTTDQDLAELREGMNADPALRRTFVDRMRLEVSLNTLLETSEEAVPARRVPREARVRPEVRSRWSILLAAGIAAAVLAGTAIFVALQPSPPPPTRKETADAPREPDANPTTRAESRRKAEEERARAEEDRRLKEARLAELRAKEEEAARAERQKDEEVQRKIDEARNRIQVEREAAEAALRAAETRERRAVEHVTRLDEKPAPPVPPPPPASTKVVAAKIDRVEGEVYVLAGAGRTTAASGQELPAGSGIECVGPRSFALLSYPDKTRLEVTGNSVIRDLFDAEPAAAGRAARGKQLFVEKGAVKAEIVKLPKEQPMIFATPHGEAKALGTILRLAVDPDPKKGAILEVEEGKVELRNLSGKTEVVSSGRMAVAAAGSTLASKAFPKEESILALDFEDGKNVAVVTAGNVERGPDRPGNRFCLAGVPEASGVTRFFIGDGALGLFTFQGDEVLSFDYWAESQVMGINFNFLDRTQGQTFPGVVPKLVLGKWTHVSIRLADLGDAAGKIRDEDWIVSFYLQAVALTPRKFYIDNIQVTRPRLLKPKPSETKK